MTLPMSTAKFSERKNENSYFRSKNQLDCPLERKILMTFQNANTEGTNTNNT